MFSPFDTLRQSHTPYQDSLSFLDESFFYIEQVDSFQSVHFGSNPPLDASHRTRFSELLENCHQHRMSTIKEAPIIEESAVVEYFKISDKPRNPRNHKTTDLLVAPSRPPREGLKKLLDYILPHPTQLSAKKRTALTRLRRKNAHRTKLSKLCSPDDDWIMHGFFEVLSGRQWTPNTVDV